MERERQCCSPALADTEAQSFLAELGQEYMTPSHAFLGVEAFVCHLYNSKSREINKARYTYSAFCSGSAKEKSLPPTQAFLRQHVLRAGYQTAVWRRALQSSVDSPSPHGYGWKVQ